MQKKLIVLALAGIATAPAFAADSNVTIYGRIDYGYMNRSGNSGGVTGVNSKHEFASGVQAGSRLGFKGSEDLGNGLKAIFEIESGVSVDANTGSGLFNSNRHSYVGLTGNFGTVVGGRLDGVRYGIFNKYDPFAGGTVGNFTQMTAQVDRADNSIAYISPNFSGFTVTAAYGTHVFPGFFHAGNQEAAGNVDDGRLNTLMGSYENGPISVTLDYETVKTVEPSAPITQNKVKVNTIAGSYDFGMVKVSALWDSLKVDNGLAGGNVVNIRNWFVGAKVPVGQASIKVNWGKVDDKTAFNADATKWGLGVDYALSKRTNFYADYGKIRNKTATADFQISPAANAQGNNASAFPLVGVRGFDLGIAHKF